MVEFFKRCKKGIKANGLIGLKENTALRQRIYDEEDSSVTRTDAEYKRLFTAAGLRLIKEAKQTDFPPSLFPVKMYMLESIQ